MALRISGVLTQISRHLAPPLTQVRSDFNFFAAALSSCSWVRNVRRCSSSVPWSTRRRLSGEFSRSISNSRSVFWVWFSSSSGSTHLDDVLSWPFRLRKGGRLFPVLSEPVALWRARDVHLFADLGQTNIGEVRLLGELGDRL